MRLGAIFIAGGHPGCHRIEGGRAADGGEGIPGLDQAAVGRGDHLIEGLCRQVEVSPGEGIILGQPIELQGAVFHLHHPRQYAVAGPVGGALFTAGFGFAGVVDPELGVVTGGELHIHQMLLMAALTGMVVDAAGEADARLLPDDYLAASRLIAGRQRALLQGRVAVGLEGGLIVAGTEQRQGGALAVIPAAAPGHVAVGRQLGEHAGQQLLLVDSSHGAGGNPGLIMQGAEQHQPIDECLGALAHPGIFRQLIECKQTDVVDRVVGRRVPFDEAVPIDGIEPQRQALRRDGTLLLAAAARGQEALMGEHLAGQVLGGMEAEGMVLAPEPHHVVTRLIQPVAIT
ncbi:hypothetical protein D3C81_1233550 [compost metagenome]